MELRLLDTDLRQIFVADLNAGGIAAGVQFGLDGQAGFGLVLPIRFTITSWLVSGLPRQFAVI